MMLLGLLREDVHHVNFLSYSFSFSLSVAAAFKFRVTGEGGLRLGIENPIIVSAVLAGLLLPLFLYLFFIGNCSLKHAIGNTSILTSFNRNLLS